MSKSKIEWLRDDNRPGYTINPVKGLCPMACPYCYARRMYKRFKWDETIRFDTWTLASIQDIPPGSKVFWGSTIELFGPWIKDEWLARIFQACWNFPKLIHIFLTKQPQNLIKYSPFPDNCWVGVTITDGDDDNIPLAYFKKIEAKVKFISFEPLLDWWVVATTDMVSKSFKIAGINWLIIGLQTPYSKKTAPKLSWVQEIVEAADKANIPVFLKNNLKPLLENDHRAFMNPLYWRDGYYTSPDHPNIDLHLRQEIPERNS